jgi:cell division septal protein FtsQ
MKKRKYSIKKSKTLRKRRKSSGLFSKFYFPIIGGFLFTGVAIFGLFYASFQLNITDVKVGGMGNIPEDALLKAIKNKLTLSYSLFGKEITIDNFFLPQSKKMSSMLDDFPQIESIGIKRDYKDKSISFEIKEKKPTVAWKEAFSGDCFLADNNGTYIKDCGSEDISGLVEINEETDVCKNNTDARKNVILGAEKIIKQTAKLGILTVKFSLTENDKLSLDLDSGCKIFFNVNDDLDWELKKLEAVLKQDRYSGILAKFEYIDVRFGNQAIIK